MLLTPDSTGIDTTYYTTFPSALKKANKYPQASMVLLDDVRFGGKAGSQAIKTNLTIDLNGYTIGDTLSSTSLFSLAIDTLTLHITSSRPGGQIAVNRAYNGRIYAISCSKGQLLLDHVTIHARNTALYSDSCKSVAVTAVSVGAAGSAQISECSIYAAADGTVTAVGGSGNAGKPVQLDIRSCALRAEGRQKVYGAICYNTALLSNCEIAVSAIKQAYGIYTYAPITLTNDSIRTLTERESSYALYATQDTALFVLSRSQFIAEAGAITAYGVYLYKGKIEAEDCLFSGTARQDTAHVPVETNARGIAASAHCDLTLTRCTAQAKATNPEAGRGACAVSVSSTSTVSVHDCEITAEGAENTIALRGSGDKSSAAVVNIRDSRLRTLSGKTAYGIYCYNTTSISDCGVAVSASANTAYGLFIYNRNDTTLPSPVQAEVHRTHIAVSSLKQAYGIYTRANTVLASNTIAVQAENESATGLYIYSDTIACHASQTSFTAEAHYHNAYGVNAYRGRFRAEDCLFRATAHQDTVITQPAESNVRGVSSGVNAILDLTRCTIYANATNPTYAKGAYAVLADKSGHLTLRGCHLQADGAVTSCAIRNMAAGVLDSCTLTSNAAVSEAYALYTATSNDSITVRDCRLLSEAPTKNNFVNKNANMEGRMYFYNGYYSHDTNLRMYMPEGYGIYRLYDGEDYQAGYRYTIQPVANPDAVVARMYNTQTGAHIADYKRVASALWYAVLHEETELTIVVVADCQLDWSTYIVPKKTTLVIGYKEDQNKAIGTNALRSYTTNKKRQHFARLELLDDAELIVEGVLEVSGVQQSESRICGTVSGEFGYGQLHLAPTASIVLERDARLQAWGYITGSGTITAQSGSYVYEFLQLGDWKGGTVTYEMVNNRYKVFPMTHFFYQNIECPLIYHAGSKAFGSTMISAGGYSSTHDGIRLLDDHDALFVFASTNGPDATIRKEYDPLTDRVTWTTNGDIALDQLGIYHGMDLAGQYNLVSSQYVLPLGTNMTIRANTGTLEIRHDVLMPPGTHVEIGPEAGFHIPEKVNLYLYDTDQWGWYGAGNGYATVTYSPGWSDCPRDSVLTDARMEISGTARVDGALYTTEGGAAIVGTDSAEGHIHFTHGALVNNTVYQLTGTYDEHRYTASVATMPALLNADSTRTPTLKALEGAVYTYTNGRWFSADTIPDLIPDTIPTDTISIDTIPVIIPDTTDTIPVIIPDTVPIEGLTVPQTNTRGQLILHNGTVYILTPDGRYYTLLGLPGRKE